MMDINGHQIYLERHGSSEGPVLVFMHHGLGSTRAWKGQFATLVGSGWQVILYDRWGYGRSEARSGIDIPLFQQDQEDLIALLDKLELQHVILVGHSDGGTIALYLAARYPKRVAAVVSIAAHIYVETKMHPGIESVREAWEHDERFRSAMHKVHGEKFESVFWNWYKGWYRSEVVGWNIRSELADIICPVFVVQGTEDEHATPQHARDIAAGIQRSQLWLVEGATHMLPQEMPVAFNARLGEFLSYCLEVAATDDISGIAQNK